MERTADIASGVPFPGLRFKETVSGSPSAAPPIRKKDPQDTRYGIIEQSDYIKRTEARVATEYHPDER